MKLFYNSEGKIVGSIESPIKEVEDGITMPDTTGVTAPLSVADRLRNPKNPLQIRHLRMKDGKIKEMSPKEKEREDDTHNEGNKRIAEERRQARREARRENSSS